MDRHLRWELSGRIENDPDLTFREVREVAYQWAKEVHDDTSTSKTVQSRGVSGTMNNETMLDLMKRTTELQEKILHKQQDLSEKVEHRSNAFPLKSPTPVYAAPLSQSNKNFYSQKGSSANARDSSGNYNSPRPVGPCWKCNQYGHLHQQCQQKRTLKSSSPSLNSERHLPGAGR